MEASSASDTGRLHSDINPSCGFTGASGNVFQLQVCMYYKCVDVCAIVCVGWGQRVTSGCSSFFSTYCWVYQAILSLSIGVLGLCGLWGCKLLASGLHRLFTH